jgi:hypothetical protein
MEKIRLNIVLHKIVSNEQLIQSRYDTTEDFSYELVMQLRSVLKDFSTEVGIFLDDGYQSQFSFALRLAHDCDSQIFIPIITQLIGMDGYISHKEIEILKQEKNIRLCSHSFSHAALGVYENNRVLPTPKGGLYHNMPMGHDSILTEQEIQFQLQESYKHLSNLGIQTDTFVYPYGIYSEDVLSVVKEAGVYAKAYTCDDGLEQVGVKSLAIPRLLIDNTLSISEWIKKAENIVER